MLGLECYVSSDSNAYNRNKLKAKAIAGYFLEKTGQSGTVKLDRDVSDALLQAIWYLQNTLGKKLDYANFVKPVPAVQEKPKATPKEKPKPAPRKSKAKAEAKPQETPQEIQPVVSSPPQVAVEPVPEVIKETVTESIAPAKKERKPRQPKKKISTTPVEKEVQPVSFETI